MMLWNTIVDYTEKCQGLSHYQISFNQVLESERRLQLSNLLKVFDIKYGSGDNVSP